MRPFDANASDIDSNDSSITIQRVPRTCEWCHEVFNELPQLEAHQIVCMQNKTFECSSCSEKFPTPRRLDKHMKFSHSPSNSREMSRSFDFNDFGFLDNEDNVDSHQDDDRRRKKKLPHFKGLERSPTRRHFHKHKKERKC